MIVGKAIRGKTGVIIDLSPGGSLRSSNDTGGARVDTGGTGGERGAVGGMAEIAA